MSIITLGLMDGVGGFALTGLTPAPTTLTLQFTGGVTPSLSGPAAVPGNWTLSTGTGIAATVTGVAVVGATVVLNVTAMTPAATYTLTLPNTGITGNPGSQTFGGPFTWNFTAPASTPVINIARSVDARLLDVVFNSPPNPASALDTANYSVAGIVIFSVQQMTAGWYRLTTSKQTVDAVYAVTYSGT